MIDYCKRCKQEIKTPNFSEEEKLEIWSMKESKFSLFGIKKIEEYGDLNNVESTILFQHVNKSYGKCIKCSYSELNSENVECPKCKAFNLNWAINLSFNEEFCNRLEYCLDPVFELEDDLDKEVKGIWCDGVFHIASEIKELSKEKIKESGTIKTTAWMGKNGQTRYQMTIKLGKNSLSNYLLGKSMIDCIPEKGKIDWVEIDTQNKTVQVTLM